jgi:hypothetical protein
VAGGGEEARREARIELRWSDGTLLGAVVVPPTGGKYRWTDIAAPVTLPGGPGDLHLVLSGSVRLDWFRIDARPSGIP